MQQNDAGHEVAAALNTAAVIRNLHKKEGDILEEYGDRELQTLFTELKDYERKGVSMLINGLPASPMQIVQAHVMREESSYMRDYVLNDQGDLKELCFDDVKEKNNGKVK